MKNKNCKSQVLILSCGFYIFVLSFLVSLKGGGKN